MHLVDMHLQERGLLVWLCKVTEYWQSYTPPTANINKTNAVTLAILFILKAKQIGTGHGHWTSSKINRGGQLPWMEEWMWPLGEHRIFFLLVLFSLDWTNLYIWAFRVQQGLAKMRSIYRQADCTQINPSIDLIRAARFWKNWESQFFFA